MAKLFSVESERPVTDGCYMDANGRGKQAKEHDEQRSSQSRILSMKGL